MSRQTPLDPSTFTPEQEDEYQRVLRIVASRGDGYLGGPFDPLLLNADLSRRIRGLALLIWERTSLDRGIVELAISIAGRFWEANVEWTSHAPKAVEYGVPQAVIDEVFAGRRPTGAPEYELVYDVCQSMLSQHGMPRELYGRAVAAFGERGLVEMMAAVGYYSLISMLLNAFEVQPASGITGPFDRRHFSRDQPMGREA